MPLPRDVTETRSGPHGIDLRRGAWSVQRDEVLKDYAQQRHAH